jgi:hypothetical protein
MKKQALRALVMLVSIIALAYATAIASSAQSLGQQIRADVPFDFVVGDKTLAAGEYSVSQISSAGGIAVRSRDGEQGAIRLSHAVLDRNPRQKTSLTFLRYGNQYFLSQIWVSGSAEGRQVLKSKAERSADRELARRENSMPEVVTIVATIE